MQMIRPIIAAAAVLILAILPAQAAMTNWQDLGGGKARLVASLDPATSAIVAVVDVVLKPGWKTYWREPGGAGIPPVFDFSQSDKFLSGPADFPVPEYLSAGGVRFPGYKDQVRFVINGQAAELSPEGAVRLNLLIGVCEEICIPATASFSIPFSDLMRADPQTEELIRDAKKKLPHETADGMAIKAISRGEAGTLEVLAQIPKSSSRADLFAEAPPGWYVSSAKLVSFEAGQARFSFKARPVDPAPSDDATRFRLTIAGDEAAIEQWLDLPPAQ